MEKLKKKKEQLFSAGNMFMYVTGDIDGKLEDLYAAADGAAVNRSELRQNAAPVPYDFMKRDIKTMIRSSNLDFIGLSFDVDFSKFTKEEADILLNLIFTLSSSRVYRDLIDGIGLIYDYEYYLETFGNVGRIYFEIETEDVTAYEALAAIMRMFRGVKTISLSEYENAVLYSVTNADLRSDSAQYLNSCNSKFAHLHGQGYKSIGEEKALCRAVTKDRLEQMARETFIPDNLCLAFRTTAKLDNGKIRSIVPENLM